MKRSGPDLPEMQEQLERGDEEDTGKRAAIRSRQKSAQPEKISDQQSNKTVFEKTEEGSVTTSKEAPGKSDEQKNDAESSLVDAPVSAPNEQAELARPVVTSNEKPPEILTRPAAMPRKNVIPPRPTSFENGSRTPSSGLRSARATDSSKQATQNTLSETGKGQDGRDASRAAADLPTGILPSVPDQDARANEQPGRQKQLADEPTRELPAQGILSAPQAEQARERKQTAVSASQNTPIPDSPLPTEQAQFVELPTTPLPATLPVNPLTSQKGWLTRGRAIFLALLLAILIINATVTGFGQFFGPQGWGSAFNGPASSGQNLLNQLQNQLRNHTPTPGTTAQPTAAPLTPTQIVNALMANMTLDQKLGQMLMVRFASPDYSPQLNAMITQYHVGSVIEYQSNIQSKSQLIALNSQIQHSGDLPMIVAIDQEGGTVDRLVNLDGAQPSASAIGATGNSNNAYQQGLKDAQELASYGFNLNLAPVVDVDVPGVYNAQLYERTYGTTPASVTQMAGAYLKGLQQSGKVLGTIKHFPGLGDTSTDPHYGLPYLTRSLAQLNAIDWAPYKNLIAQGDVYSIMITHEIVKALDTSVPSSLSAKVVSVLRDQLGFQGVLITDGLTMGGILNYYTLGQAAVMAVKAGEDLLMDPGSPDEVAQMVDALKQAVNDGTISQQHIDDSVRRVLLLKYQMGLLHVNS